MNTKNPEIRKAWYTLRETAVVLGIGRDSVYERCRTGAIPSTRIGASWMVPAYFVEELMAAGTTPPDDIDNH